MKLKLTNFFITIILCLFSMVSFAQVDPPADDDPLPVPINSKLIWLGVFGIVFAVCHFKNKKTVSK